MGDMAKSLFIQFFLLSLLFLFFSLNPCISKTESGTGLKFCTQVGFDDPTYKKKRDKIGMGYESRHIMELLSVQCLHLYCCLQYAVVLVGVVLKDLLGGTTS